MRKGLHVFLFLTLVVILAVTRPLVAYGLVDLKSANYSDAWNDLTFDAGSLIVSRAYNSRAFHDGMFGFRWCSDFEDTLLPAQRGGRGALILTHCGAGLQELFVAVERSGGRETRYRRLDGLATIHMVGNHYVVAFDDPFPTCPDCRSGAVREFDLAGRLVGRGSMVNAADAWAFSYHDQRLTTVVDGRGNKIVISYYSNGKVKQIEGSNGKRTEYWYSLDGDLIEARTASGNRYTYEYDLLHNLVRVNYPDGTFARIGYDILRDQVTTYQSTDGCREEYRYYRTLTRAHYSAEVSRICSSAETRSRYEFWYAQDRYGGWLYRSLTTDGGNTTEVFYDRYGKASRIIKNGLDQAIRYSDDRTRRTNGPITNSDDPSVEVVEEGKAGAIKSATEKSR